MERYSDTVLDERNLAPVRGALVFVRNQDGSTPTIYDDSGATITNAVTDEYGVYNFNALANFYDLKGVYNGRVIFEQFGVRVGTPTLPVGAIADSLGTATGIAPSQRATQEAINARADAALGNVVGISRTRIGQGGSVQLSGTTYPFQDRIFDSESFGTPVAPIVYSVSPATGFFAPKNTYAYIGAGHIGGFEQTDLLQIRGAPSSASQNQNYTARQFFTSVTTNLGGTALTMAASAGQLFGFGSIAVAYPGATNIRNLTGGEINVQASAGATVAYKSGLQIAATPDDQAQGTVYDAAISLSNQAGAVGFGIGLMVSSNANGKQSVSAGGSLIAALDNPICANGVNFNGVTFTQNAFSSNGAAIDGSGNGYLRSLNLQSAGATIMSGLSNVVSSQAWQFRTSGATSGLYDSAMIAFGGTGAQGAGGIQFDVSNLRPAADNVASLGDASHRFTQLYAATTTIATSDRNHKEQLGKLSDPQFAAVLDAIGEVDLVAFKFKDAIAEKGETTARKHAGIIAQDVQEAFERHGLNAFEWGVLGTDPDMETIEQDYRAERQVTQPATRPEKQIVMVDGKPVQKIVDVPYDEPVFDQMTVVDETGAPVMIPGQPARTVPITDAAGKVRLHDDGQFMVQEIPATEDTPQTYPVPRMETVTLKRFVSRQKQDADGKPAVIWSVRMAEFEVMRAAWMERELRKVAKA
jgi:hypothetical protein